MRNQIPKSACFAAFVAVLYPPALAQKPPLVIKYPAGWTYATGLQASADGKFVAYNLARGITIQSIGGSYKHEVPMAREFHITADSKNLVYTNKDGQVVVFTWANKDERAMSVAASYTFPEKGNDRWMVCRPKEGKTLLLEDLADGTEKSFPSVSDFKFDKNGKILLMVTESQTDPKNYSVLLFNLGDGTSATIHQSANKPTNFVFDDSADRVAFIDKAGDSKDSSNAVWLYKPGTNQAEIVASDKSTVIRGIGMIAPSDVTFTKDVSRILFTVAPVTVPPKKEDPKGPQVDVWSYRDNHLFSASESKRMPWLNSSWRRAYVDSVNLETGKIIPLSRDYETWFNWTDSPIGSHILVSKELGELQEALWRNESMMDFSIVSLDDGSRHKLISIRGDSLGGRGNEMPAISPDEKYVTYFDRTKGDFFVYDIHKGTTIDATRPIKTSLVEDEDLYPTHPATITTVCLWAPHDRSFYVFDRYDLWEVDPTGHRRPVNITRGYGRKHRLVFSTEIFRGNDFMLPVENGSLLLTALDRTNKHNGFYRVRLGSNEDPVKLSMGPYCYNLESRGLHIDTLEDHAFPSIKAGDGFILRRMRVDDAPNYFYSRDFKTFTRMTDCEPQKKYNWMTDELIRWKTPDGQTAEGIVYKPENFDPKKKYPVIFYYYETFSDTLNLFQRPGPSEDRINIPYFVSNGYVVCIPDIHYRPGYIGESAYECIESAAKYMCHFPWVDSKGLGLQGHSFGGFETNFVVTKSKMFAAAFSVSGIADWSGIYGTSAPRDKAMVESGQSRMGTTPMDDPEVYVRNSPVYHLKGISTPILLVVGKKDTNVPPAQGIAMFTDLRRLGKPAWLLSYDNGSHSVGGPDAVDMTIRAKEFFDHYLKHGPVPDWMRG